MNAGKIVKNGVEVATFEVSAPFTTVFADVADEYPDAFYKVKNESWIIGSLTEPPVSCIWRATCHVQIGVTSLSKT